MPEWKVPGYTELRALGSGGFGEVVLARHDESGSGPRCRSCTPPGVARGAARSWLAHDDGELEAVKAAARQWPTARAG